MEKEMATTPVFLPGESQGREAWWTAIYGVTKSQTRLKRLSSSSSSRYTKNVSFLPVYFCFLFFVFFPVYFYKLIRKMSPVLREVVLHEP